MMDEKGKKEMAQKYFKKFLKEYFMPSWAFERLGFYYFNSGRKNDAKTYFLKALKHKEDFPDKGEKIRTALKSIEKDD
jgi:tetratricopeptide (TPR) repeat protein